DPVFLVSLANAISETDTAYWNSKLDEVIETDPVFLGYPSSDITEDNIENWKNVYDSYNANAHKYLTKDSLAGKITGEDITRWNTYASSLVETDSIFLDSYAYYITAQDAVNLDNLMGSNTGDLDLSTYALDSVVSDSMDAFRDSIAQVRIELTDSIVQVRKEWNDSIAKLRIVFNDTIEDVHEGLVDSIGKVRGELNDSIAALRIAFNVLNDSIGGLRGAVVDSTDDFRIALGDSIGVLRTELANSETKLRGEIIDINNGEEVLPLAIGDEYGGGIIFWLDASKAHGLIAATSDISTPAQWGEYFNTKAIIFGVYAGMQNTNLIIAKQGVDGYAADLCAEHFVNTENNEYYDDWYLPSDTELRLLYYYNETEADLENPLSGAYWSSTEVGSGTARYATSSTSGGDEKTKSKKVRPIRAF
ncbi:MAG: DUF1566 domain-containing protein, partial [candidate division Zixibacteria bacterium]|nr:DUF1566 domain-containing protein [candidate division Zixibacteria bacterium]